LQDNFIVSPTSTIVNVGDEITTTILGDSGFGGCGGRTVGLWVGPSNLKKVVCEYMTITRKV
jgi:hypothetical protein